VTDPLVPILNNMGIKTTLLCAGGLLLAIGGPVSYYSASDVVSAVRKNWLSDSADTAAAAPQPFSSDPNASTTDPVALPSGEQPVFGQNASPARAAPMPNLDEVLRFDVTVDWVMQRWPRVSTGLPHLQLHGYRVPLVTGTAIGDVAGSLTYFFNARQQVQRITLRGTTGDPRVLIGLVTGRYHFARRLTNDPGVALYEAVDSNNQPAGALKIRSAGVIKSNQPYTRFEVDLVIDRPE